MYFGLFYLAYLAFFLLLFIIVNLMKRRPWRFRVASFFRRYIRQSLLMTGLMVLVTGLYLLIKGGDISMAAAWKAELGKSVAIWCGMLAFAGIWTWEAVQDEKYLPPPCTDSASSTFPP